MKVQGDVFIPEQSNIGTKKQVSDDVINEKYLRGEIRIITEQARYPLDTIKGILESGKYDLNPEYQRRKRWSIVQKSKLIESFIINVPIPPIFLYEVDYAKYEVMDGLQRLTAIDDFYKGIFALEGLEEWPELNGKRYENLPIKIKEGIDRRYLSSIILLNETAKTSEDAKFLKQIVFGRLNSGGDKLTPQEIRNALYTGEFNTFCITLSQNDNFRKLWKYPIIKKNIDGLIENEDELLNSGDSYRKMEDVELVLRYFAYRHISSLSSMSQETFLDNYLIQANKFSPETLSSLKNEFEEATSLIYSIFQEDAFLMPSGTRSKVTPTKTIYDPLMQSISKVLDKKELLLENAQELKRSKFSNKEDLEIIGKDGRIDLFDGKYNGKAIVEKRILYFDKLFQSFLG